MPPGDWNSSPGAQAEALREAFPSYVVVVRHYGDEPRFELVTTNDSNPWCLISSDVEEIWHELQDARHQDAS